MKVSVQLLGSETEQVTEVDVNQFYIGRSAQCEVVINHQSMSRKHCFIEFTDGKIFITDLASTNGVTIDGVRIAAHERSYFINYLPLMIGAAIVKIDVSHHQERLTPTSKPALQENSRTITRPHRLPSEKTLKVKTPSKAVPTKKEIILAVMAVMAFLLLLYWFLNQN